jgi:hypothetical protein
MDENKKWSGNVSLKGVAIVALVSLVIGLGISGSLDWLSPSRAVNLLATLTLVIRGLRAGCPILSIWRRN